MAEEDVVIAKMDATANDVPDGFDVQVCVIHAIQVTLIHLRALSLRIYHKIPDKCRRI